MPINDLITFVAILALGGFEILMALGLRRELTTHIERTKRGFARTLRLPDGPPGSISGMDLSPLCFWMEAHGESACDECVNHYSINHQPCAKATAMLNEAPAGWVITRCPARSLQYSTVKSSATPAGDGGGRIPSRDHLD